MDKHLDAEALSDYAEGLPDVRTRAAAEAHLAGCAQCRRELAAIQAYFRDMAALEPVQAPSDFLSRVRARLPRPSPWERAWAAVLIPFRSIPVPIAVSVILGVTAITVYVRQRGPENRGSIPAPAAGPASGSAEPAEDVNPPTASQPALKDIGPAEVGSVPPAPSAGSARAQKPPSREPQGFRYGSAEALPKSRSAAKKAAEATQPIIPEPGPSEAAGSVEAAASSPAPASPTSPASAPPAAPGSADAKQSPAKRAPAPVAPAPPPSAGAAQGLRDVEAQGWLDNPASVYILDNSSAPADLPLDKTMPVEEQNAVPGQAEAAAGHAAAKRKKEEKSPVEERSKASGGRNPPTPGKTASPAPVPASGYALSLKAKGDTAAVLAGLRSMGVEAESEYASPGEIRFRLSVPAPMLRELRLYLARHGESRPEGRIPSADSGSVLAIRLRLLFPAR